MDTGDAGGRPQFVYLSASYRIVDMYSLRDLKVDFARRGISCEAPGFYDSDAFVEEERRDPHFLERYAQYVQLNSYDEFYLARAQSEIPEIARILYEELVKDGRTGACVDVSGVLSRILEKEGFWNYTLRGSLTIKAPKHFLIPTQYFWSVDYTDRPFDAGHAWVVAPPFTILDLTIKQQPMLYAKDLVPDYVVSRSGEEASVHFGDVISPEFIAAQPQNIPPSKRLSYWAPGAARVSRRFPPITLDIDHVNLKYTTCGIAAPDRPLEAMTSLELNGRYGEGIYRDLVLPHLEILRKQPSS